MEVIEDIMKALERIPLWKRLSSVPSEIEELKKRIAALEAKLSPAKGEQCPRCKELTFTLTETLPMPGPFQALGAMEDHFECASCGYKTKKRVRD